MKSNMSNILILGCSYTQGHTHPYENSWSWCLSKRHPHLNFLDYSKGGSSVQWAAHCLECVSADYTIAQYTSPFRLSLWPEDWQQIAQHRKQRSHNYNTWDSDSLELDCVFASSGWLGTPRFGWPGNSEPLVPFVREYFTQLPSHLHTINYQGVVEQLHQRVDFGFKWSNEDPLDVVSAEDNISDWSELMIDDYYHLGVEGSERVADWIEKDFLIPNGII